MNPAQHVGVILAECRRRDYEFDPAWNIAMRSLPKPGDDEYKQGYLDDWKKQLRWAKPHFRRAYLLLPKKSKIVRNNRQARTGALGSCDSPVRASIDRVPDTTLDMTLQPS